MKGRANDTITFPGAPETPPCEIGDRISFVPTAFIDLAPATLARSASGIPQAYRLAGTVIYVNAAHRYYTVEAPCFAGTVRESFKY